MNLKLNQTLKPNWTINNKNKKIKKTHDFTKSRHLTTYSLSGEFITFTEMYNLHEFAHLFNKQLSVPKNVVVEIKRGLDADLYWVATNEYDYDLDGIKQVTEQNITFFYRNDTRDNKQLVQKVNLQQPLILISTDSKLDSTQAFYQTLKAQAKSLRKENVNRVLNQFDTSILSVSMCFHKYLVVRGVGYKFSVNRRYLTVDLGYSHEVKFDTSNTFAPSMMQVSTKENLIALKNRSLRMLTNYSALIKEQKKPDVYKGKGIRYKNELIFRKEGKKQKQLK